MAADRSQSSKIKSPKQRREAKNNRSLIGREMQQDWFQKSLVRPDDHESRIIFSISGQGGVGKTTLLKDFRRIAEEFGHVCAYVDEGVATNPVNDVPEVMWRLAEDFERQGFKFDEFQKRYKDYRVKKQELEASPEGPKGLMGDMVRGGAKMGLEVMKDLIPGGGLIDSEMVATKTGELANYGWERFRNKDDERLMRETLEELTPLFLKGMARVPIEKTVVLLLDTYEVTGAFLEPWVLALLEEEFGAVGREFMVCIGGRNPLDRNVWTDWESCIARSPLEPFTEAEARDFLAQKGILGEAVIAEIWRLSAGGLPLLVSMMALNAPTGIDAVVDACDDAVTRFLIWETDEAKKALALDAALARAIDSDVVLALGSELFDWLRGCPFVIREGSVWRYHSVVRELMVRFQWQKSRNHWTSVHGKLAAHYETVRVGLGLESGKEIQDKEWRRLSLEWFYHSLCAGRQAKLGMALNGFLVVLSKQVRAFALEWAEVMVQVGQETKYEELQNWGGQLLNLFTNTENSFLHAVPVIEKLIDSSIVEAEARAIAFTMRATCHAETKNYDMALQDLKVAIEHNSNIDITYLMRGEVYRSMEAYEEALKNLNKAIELNDRRDGSICSRAETYRSLQRYEEALKDFDRAIELEPTDWKYGQRGQTYRLLKRYEEALKDFDRAIELKPTDWMYGQRAEIYRLLKRYEEALIDFDRAIELDSEYSWAISSRAKTYQSLKRYEEALIDFDRAIELKPTDWRYGQRAETYRLMKRYEEALIDFGRAIELDSEYSWAIGSRGQTYQVLKQYEEALKDFDRAIELNPESSWAITSRAKTYQVLKRYEEALKDFDRAIELAPTAWKLSNRGQVNLSLKRHQEAVENFNRSIELDPEDDWYSYLRSIAHQNLNQPNEAQAGFQKAIDLAQTKYAIDPGDWRNTFNLALYYFAVGHQEESDTLYRSGLNAPQEMIEMAIRDLEDLREWRIENDELRIGEWIDRLNAGSTIVEG